MVIGKGVVDWFEVGVVGIVVCFDFVVVIVIVEDYVDYVGYGV